MEGSNRSRNGERMIGTRRKIDAGRGIDSFRSGKPTERSRDDKTAEDARHRRKVMQENVGECRRTQENTGEHRRTQGRHSDSGMGCEVIEGVS